jgi:ABC-type polysaccharide/polyol phosphate transport system ATPase subunit
MDTGAVWRMTSPVFICVHCDCGGENIYLNGAILGMRRTEIRRKFDEIVSFAQVEKFLDTAAHLEPEILIVDEVLAVGDFSENASV